MAHADPAAVVRDHARHGVVSALLLALSVSPALAQRTDHVFSPLVADPKQPHFFATWQWVTSPIVTAQVASVGLGEDITVIHGRDNRWEINIAAGVFSQFNMNTQSNDLINTDFVFGFPFSYRHDAMSARIRVYHQSSHLGDEFILNTMPTRVNLSFEAVEMLVAADLGRFRALGGFEYIVRREPGDLKPALLHGGLEYRQARPLIRLGGLGGGRVIAAVDIKSTQERKWALGWSARAGIEVRTEAEGAIRNFSVQLEAYSGPAAYGQFYQANVRSVGLGVHLAL